MMRPALPFHILFFLFLVVSPPAMLSAAVIEQLIAVIDGEPYTLTNIKVFAKTKGKIEFPTGDLNRINEADRDVLEQFITEKLLETEIREAGIKVSDAEVDEYIAQIKARNKLSDDDLKTALSREGQTLASYRASVKSELEKNEMINRQVRAKVNISNEDAERYYKLNMKNYRSGERAQLRHILLSVREKASEEETRSIFGRAGALYERLKAGEDFAKLAIEYSEGAGHADGGNIGWVQRGTLVKEIEDVAFEKLSVGQVSEPFRSSLGVHIVKLEARDPGKVLPFATVAPKIKEELYVKALDERFGKWVKSDLRKKHHVDVKIPGVVFKAEDVKGGTMDSLVAGSPRLNKSTPRSWYSYLNPLSYVTKEIDVEEDDPKSPMYGKKIVSVFGVPLFTSEANDDVVPDVLSPPPPEKPAEKQSGGFFSSIIESLNPFSSKKP
ncbi:MAG: peptidylprolyl isomerase [Deltaproteobacteria bacterium]|nr:peptidylprolyl isomerase [Deltaproteobacteria bacterium]